MTAGYPSFSTLPATSSAAADVPTAEIWTRKRARVVSFAATEAEGFCAVSGLPATAPAAALSPVLKSHR